MAAEEIIFKISADASDANKETDVLEANLKAVNEAAEQLMQSNHELGATFEEVYGDIQPLSARLRELEDRMYELALQGKQNTAEFKELQNEAVRYRQTLISVDASVDALAQGGRGLVTALQLGSAVTAGYGAVQGSMIALGIENENLEKSFVKLQAVQTILASLEQLKLALDKQSILVTKAKAIATGVMTGAQLAWTTATAGTTAAMGVLRLAMLAIPIVAIIAGIVALAGWLSSLASSTEELEAAYKEFNSTIETTRKLLDDQASAAAKNSEHELALARAKGASIDEIHEKELKAMADAEKARKQSLRVEQIILNNQYKSIKKFRELGEDDMVASMTTEIQTSRQKYSALKAQDGDYFRSRELLQINHEKKKLEEEKKAQQESASNWKAANEQRKRQREEAERLELDRARTLKDLFIANIQDEELQKMTALKESYARQREELIKKFGEDTQLLGALQQRQTDEEIKLLTEAEAKKKEALDKANAQKIEDDKKAFDKLQAGKRAQLEGELIQARDDFEAKQALERKFAMFEMEQALLQTDLTEGEMFKIREQYNQKIAELDKASADRAKAIEADKVAAMKATYEAGFSAISTLSEGIFAVRIANAEDGSKKELELQKKAFEFNKKMQIAQATIQGIQGVQSAFTAGQQSPLTPLFPAYPFLQAAAAGAVALGNILKIKATTFQGGGSVTGGGGGVTPPNIPTPNEATTDTNADTTTLTGGLNGSGQTLKVVLVDSEVKQALTDSAKVDVISTVG